MPDTKITALAAIGANPINVATFPIPMVDLTDTSMAASGTTKKVTVNQILGAGGTATLASATITGNLTLSAGTANGVGYLNASKVLTAGSALIFDGTNLGIGGTGQLRFATSGGAIGDNYIGTENSFSMKLHCGRGSTSSIEIASDKLLFYTSASERYRIASDGVATWSNVGGVAGTAMTLNSTGLGVGASPNFKLDVAGAANSAPITLLRLNNTGTTGGGPGIAARLQFNAGATALGFVQGCNFASGSIGVQISGDGTNIHQTIDSSGNVGIGVAPAGTGGCLQLKSGITFPATQVASTDPNTLDDYEEGTWTGTLAGATTNPTTPVTATGRYTKIGRQVFIDIHFNNVNTTGASGQITVAGAPFASNGSVGSTGAVMMSSIGSFSGIPVAFIGTGTTEIALYTSSSAGALGFVNHNAGTSRSLWMSLTYSV